MASRSWRLYAWKAIRVRVLVMPARAGHAAGDHVGQLLVAADPDDGHQVGLAGHRVHLGDAVDVGQLGGQFGDPGRLGVDEDEGVDHAGQPTGSAVGIWGRSRSALASSQAAIFRRFVEFRPHRLAGGRLERMSRSALRPGGHQPARVHDRATFAWHRDRDSAGGTERVDFPLPGDGTGKGMARSRRAAASSPRPAAASEATFSNNGSTSRPPAVSMASATRRAEAADGNGPRYREPCPGRGWRTTERRGASLR